MHIALHLIAAVAYVLGRVGTDSSRYRVYLQY